MAQVLRRDGRDYVMECEGGHIDLAPTDAIEDAILAHLRQRFGRVSVERIVAAPVSRTSMRCSLPLRADPCVSAMTRNFGQPPVRDRWLGRRGTGPLLLMLAASPATSRWSMAPRPSVIAGGLGLRIADVLLRSGFSRRFTAKGRFEDMLSAITVKIITHPQPGLSEPRLLSAEEHGR